MSYAVGPLLFSSRALGRRFLISMLSDLIETQERENGPVLHPTTGVRVAGTVVSRACHIV